MKTHTQGAAFIHNLHGLNVAGAPAAETLEGALSSTSRSEVRLLAPHSFALGSQILSLAPKASGLCQNALPELAGSVVLGGWPRSCLGLDTMPLGLDCKPAATVAASGGCGSGCMKRLNDPPGYGTVGC